MPVSKLHIDIMGTTLPYTIFSVVLNALWSIKANSKKSAIVHFRLRSRPLTSASFTLGELVIPISSHYIYLGIPLDNHLTFQTAVHTRTEKVLCSFYALVGHLMKIGGSSHNVFKRLFDSMVAPILRLWSTCVVQILFFKGS